MVNPITAIANGFKNYVNFTGRSTRAEYWWWALFVLVGYVVAVILGALVLPPVPQFVPRNPNIRYETISTPNLLFAILFYLAILLPSLAVVIRRLRDAGYSWGWYFISLVPFVGGIWLLVLLCLPSSTSGWGEPTAQENAPSGALPHQYYG